MQNNEVFQEINRLISNKQEINDEILFYIWDYLAEVFAESRDDEECQCYEQLLDRLDKIWDYQEFDGLSSDQSYMYGGIWGCLSMLSYIKKKKMQSQKSHKLAAQYGKDVKYVFLNSIKDHPGIQNKRLAEICNVTPARISQIAGEAITDGLVSTQVFGKEKCYFIRTLGENVHDIIQKQRGDLVKKLFMADYKMFVISNYDIDLSKEVVRSNFYSILGRLSRQNNFLNVTAFSKMQEEIQASEIIELKEERKNDLWEMGMSNSYRKHRIFWGQPKGVNLINQL